MDTLITILALITVVGVTLMAGYMILGVLIALDELRINLSKLPRWLRAKKPFNHRRDRRSHFPASSTTDS